MIERIEFGTTGHHSSRVIFGAAALGGMKQVRADKTLELLDQYSLNHIDTAASYGDSELRLAPFLKTRRADFFVASKTGKRTYDGAMEELKKSLERLGIDQLDLIQMHNLAQERDWETAMGPGGALEALKEAQSQGMVKHIGVTGHGTYIAAMHKRSLDAFAFTSILTPYNFTMMQQPEYAADFEALYALCTERKVAMQTIKAMAARRWTDTDTDKRFSWYKPIRDQAALARAIAFVLTRPGLFLNSTSDATLLPTILELANKPQVAPTTEALRADIQQQDIEPLFVRDISDDVQV